MVGQELADLITAKWTYPYDVQIKKIKGRIFFQVMWKFLGQASFHLSEKEYYEHLNGVCSYINAWGVESQIKQFITETKEKPRLGKAVSLYLDLGEVSSEWIL